MGRGELFATIKPVAEFSVSQDVNLVSSPRCHIRIGQLYPSTTCCHRCSLTTRTTSGYWSSLGINSALISARRGQFVITLRHIKLGEPRPRVMWITCSNVSWRRAWPSWKGVGAECFRTQWHRIGYLRFPNCDFRPRLRRWDCCDLLILQHRTGFCQLHWSSGKKVSVEIRGTYWSCSWPILITMWCLLGNFFSWNLLIQHNMTCIICLPGDYLHRLFGHGGKAFPRSTFPRRMLPSNSDSCGWSLICTQHITMWLMLLSDFMQLLAKWFKNLASCFV